MAIWPRPVLLPPPWPPLPDSMPKSEFLEQYISVRLFNCINNDDDILTVADIRYTPDDKIRRIPNLGKVSLAELRSFIPYVDPADRREDDPSWWEKAMALQGFIRG